MADYAGDMSRTTVLLAAVMLVVAGVPATAAFAQESPGDQPGATFAGVVGVQGAEVEGEVASRALDRQLATADSNESKAAVVANESAALREQLTDLRERRETLRERYQSGNISRGEYRAKLARITAQTRTLERRLNATTAAAEGLPEETLRERGVNVSALQELRANASNMTDGEAAEAARQIAGNGAGQGLAGDPGPPEDRGPPGERGNESDSATEDDRGPPEDRGNESASEAASGATDTGAADDRGNSSDAGEDRGNGSAADGTSGSGPPEDAGGGNSANASNSTANGENTSDDRGAANETASDGANGSNGDGAGNGSGNGSGAGAGEESDDDADTTALETRRVVSLDR